MSKTNTTIYKITFLQNDNVVEMYAKNVAESDMFGFIVVENLVFGETTSLVVDPAEERLKEQFKGIKRTYIPMHTVLRIDEVEKAASGKIIARSQPGSKVSALPSNIYFDPNQEKKMMLGPLIVGIKGIALSDSEKVLLQEPLIGGVILFARNYSDKAQLRALVAEIKALRNPPLWVAVDHEGGRVQRFINGFIRIPDMGQLGLLYEQDPPAALAQTEKWGFSMAQELLDVGVDMSFAPVVDLNKEKAKVIGNRSFHRNPKVVAILAEAWCRGVHEAGMKTCGKHFPGHGEVTVDSHEGLPVDVRDYDRIAADDLVPFQQLIQAGALDSIMPAHIRFPEIDDNPVGFSKIWLDKILRKACGFKGVVISDDLGMGGAAGMGGYPERFSKAVEGGCDLVLLCNDHPGIAELVAKTPVDSSYDRSVQIAALYGNKLTVDPDPNIEKCERAAPYMGFSR